MPKLENLSEASRNMLLTLPVAVHDDSPFVFPVKPLREARLSIVTTAGLHTREDRPFVRDDSTFRRIPSDVSAGDILQSHTSIGFDRGAMIADINVVFPLDRLRAMVADGRLGGFAPAFYSFMGALYDVSTVREKTGPEVARRLREEGADVVLLTPT